MIVFSKQEIWGIQTSELLVKKCRILEKNRIVICGLSDSSSSEMKFGKQEYINKLHHCVKFQLYSSGTNILLNH